MPNISGWYKKKWLRQLLLNHITRIRIEDNSISQVAELVDA